ncbi:MAG: hypothetical protein RL264_1305 [Bacteroidota bacterium]|jgi:ribosomal protein L15
MANKRDFKKSVNTLIADVIDECFYIQDNFPKLEAETEKLVEEAIEIYNKLIGGMRLAKDKKGFRALTNEMEEKAEYLVSALNALNTK